MNCDHNNVPPAFVGWNASWSSAFSDYMAHTGLPWDCTDGAPFLPARIMGGGGSVLEAAIIHHGDFASAPDQYVHFLPATLTGRFKKISKGPENMPTAGDWVVGKIDGNRSLFVIHHVLHRQSLLLRVASGNRDKLQPLGANVDTTFMVISVDEYFSASRTERYLSILHDSGSEPVILLNKIDLSVGEGPGNNCSPADSADMPAVSTDTISHHVNRLNQIAGDVPVHAISAQTGAGMEQLHQYLCTGRTICLLGSSGTGKSTIINHLAGQKIQRTSQVRASDSRGRHTTTARTLIILPNGAIFLDTPGLREVEVVPSGTGLSGTFPEIESLSANCKFRNCAHESEPDCAVQAAIESGELSEARLSSWKKMRSRMEDMVRRNRNRNSSCDFRKTGRRKH